MKRFKTREPVWYLKGLPYSDYLQSDHWCLFKEEYIKFRFSGWPGCERCGLGFIGQDSYGEETSEGFQITTPEPRQPRFNLHHLSYERLGQETFEDVILLCSPCHNLEHRPDSEAAKYWKRYLESGSASRTFAKHKPTLV